MSNSTKVNCQTCKKTIRVVEGGKAICPICKTQLQENVWVGLVRAFSKPEDKGIGDTVQRHLAILGGERFKQWAKDLGIPCGCIERQAEWNARWPFG